MKQLYVSVLLVALAAGPAVAQTQETAPAQTAPAASSKDQQKQLKREESANKSQAKSDKAQRKALKQEDKANAKAAKAEKGDQQSTPAQAPPQ